MHCRMKTPELDKPVARKAAHYIYGANYVPSHLSHLNNRLSSGASQLYLKHFGVGINEWRILSVLSNWPRSTAGATPLEEGALQRRLKRAAPQTPSIAATVEFVEPVRNASSGVYSGPWYQA